MKGSNKIQAFTLIEIMVATVIMVILSGLIIQISSEVLKLWNRSSGKLSAGAEARMAMDMIANDLESSIFKNDGGEWFRAENDSIKKPSNSDTISLRFFTIIKNKVFDESGNEIPGNIAAVAYNLDFASPIDGSYRGDKTFILYRMEVDPETTYKDLLNQESRTSLPHKRSTHWGDGNFIKGQNGSNYLVSNIVDFTIDFYVDDDGRKNTPTQYFEKSIKNPIRSVIYGGENATVGPQARIEHYKKPLSYADIKLTVLSDEGIDMMRHINKRPETPEEVIRLHSDVFIRRIYFKTKPF